MQNLKVLPASAGMILGHHSRSKLYSGAPRIRGDDPLGKLNEFKSRECSPHPRG